MPEYDVNWHHRFMCDKLQAFAEGEIKRLIISIPPQHGKSELTSRRLPAFLLGQNPNTRIIAATYKQKFASKFNRQVQRILEDKSYKELFPDTQISSKGTDNLDGSVKNAEEFEIIGHKGFYKSAGMDSGVTGESADVIIIDDPIKGRAEANSATVRQNIWDRYTDDFLTRTHNDSKILIVLTRWHPDDIVGRLKKGEGDKWEVINLEAIKRKASVEEDNRSYGEALWESRHSKQALLDKESLSPSTFEALYQGNPQPTGGNQYAHAFRESQLVRTTDYLPHLPIHYTLDFNVAPYMTGICAQLETLDSWKGLNNCLHLRIFAEYALEHPRNTARDLGEALAEDFEEDLLQGFFLYGDASGNNRTGLKNTKTLFQDVAIGLDFYKHYCTKRVPSSNPKYRAIGKGMMGRREFLNRLIGGELPCRVSIDPSCEKLIKDFRECLADANGRLNKQKNKKGIEEVGHMIDALQYLICHPEFLGWMAKIKKNGNSADTTD